MDIAEDTELTGSSAGGNSVPQIQSNLAPETTERAAEERHSSASGKSNQESATEPQQVVVVVFDDTYLRTLPGFLRFLQVVFSVVALICITSSGSDRGSYLLLPLSWHLRVFVFVSVASFLISLLVLVGHVTRLILMLPLQWDIFDTVVYGLLSFLFLFGASLVASAIDFYQKLDGHVQQWTIQQLIVAVVLGYMCMFLYGATAILAYREWRGLEQFHRRRFSTNSNRGSDHRKRKPPERPTVV